MRESQPGRARLVIIDACRGFDGQALFGAARPVPAGTGRAGQFAAVLGREAGHAR
jgi:hypothetical protein